MIGLKSYICYSIAKDGLYCIGCVLFPDSSHRRPNKLISEPYQNWKDALEDLKNHASCEYHCNSMAKMWAFLGTYENHASRIDLPIAETGSRTFQHAESRSTEICVKMPSVLWQTGYNIAWSQR